MVVLRKSNSNCGFEEAKWREPAYFPLSHSIKLLLYLSSTNEKRGPKLTIVPSRTLVLPHISRIIPLS
jgi:hypothetical protein